MDFCVHFVKFAIFCAWSLFFLWIFMFYFFFDSAKNRMLNLSQKSWHVCVCKKNALIYQKTFCPVVCKKFTSYFLTFLKILSSTLLFFVFNCFSLSFLNWYENCLLFAILKCYNGMINRYYFLNINALI